MNTAVISKKPRIYSNIVAGYKSVSSQQEQRVDPIDGTIKVHAGVDLPVKAGTPVDVPAGGQVWAIGYQAGGYGNYIVIAHPDAENPTSFTMYGHLQDAPELKRGVTVEAGDQIGVSGNSGRSTGPHLHYEERVLKPGEQVNFGSDQQNYTQFLQKADFIDPNLNQLGFGTWDPTHLDRSQLTRLERVQQLQLSDDEFQGYKDQLAGIEANGLTGEASYQVVSASGTYLGRYQMGPLALVDAGFKDSAGNWTPLAREYGVASNQDFLANPQAQDAALRRYADRNAEYLVSTNTDLRIGNVIGGVSLTGAGLLLASHNDRSNLNAFLNSNGANDPSDGNGFAISNYLKLGPSVHGDGSTQIANGSSQAGHWEDRTAYDPLTGLAIGGEQRVWVPGTPAGGPTSASSPIDFGRGSGWDAPAPPPHQGNPAEYSANVKVKTGPDGTVYRSYEATQDAPPNVDGRLAPFKRGDIISMEIDPQGRVVYESIRHVENGVTSLRETERDPLTGKVTVTWTDSVLIEGARFTRDHTQPGPWLDANGQTVDERQALALNQEVERLLARYPAPDPASSALAGVEAGSADDTASADIEQEIARLKNRSSVTGATEPPAAAPAPASPVNAPADDAHAILNWRPDTSPAGPALAAADGGILTDAGLQRPGGLPPAPTAVDSRDPTDPHSIHAVNGSDLESDRAMDKGQLSQVQGDISLLGSLVSWDQQSDLGHVQTALALYNRLNTGGSGVDLAGAAAGLGLISSGLSLADALKSGDLKAIVGSSASFGSSAIQAYSALNEVPLSGTLGQVSGALGTVGSVIALSEALKHGNTLQVAGAAASTVASAMMMAGSACPPLAIAGAVLSILGSMFSDEPEPRGEVRLELDATGRLQPLLLSDEDDGGNTALQAANAIVDSLNQMIQASNAAFAAQGHDVQTFGWALNPFALDGVRIGYESQLLSGFTVTTPEGHDSGLDGQGLMNVLSRHVQQHDAIVPAWQAATLLQRWQLAQADPAMQALVRQGAQHLATLTAQEHADQLQRSLDSLSTELPAALMARLQAAASPASTSLLHTALGSAGYAHERLFDVDGDGLRERSAWVAPGGAVLALNSHGDGLVQDGTQLLTDQGHGQGVNDAAWLDANMDGRLDAQDPAFSALLLWLDVNGDGINQAPESLSLAQAGVVAIDFHTRQLLWADGHRSELSAQALDSENDGHRLTTVTNASGTNVDAGIIVQNLGYERDPATGEVLRRSSFGLHLAKATGDWEGTDQAQLHRRGGETVAGTPVESHSAAAASQGAVQRDVTTTRTAVAAGDGRLTSATGALPASPQEQTLVEAGDSRLARGAAGRVLVQSGGTPGTAAMAAAPLHSTAPAERTVQPMGATTLEASDARMGQDSAAARVAWAAASMRSGAPGSRAAASEAVAAIGVGDQRLASGSTGAVLSGQQAGQQAWTMLDRVQIRSSTLGFLPLGASSTSQAMQNATAAMVRSAEDALFASPLIALAIGAGAAQWPALASATVVPEPLLDTMPPTPTPGAGYVVRPWDDVRPAREQPEPVFDDVRMLDEPPPHLAAPVTRAPAGEPASAAATLTWVSATAIPATLPPTPDDQGALVSRDQSLPPAPVFTAKATADTTLLIDYPRLEGEELPGSEDAALRITADALLGNDSTLNVSTRADVPSLRIVAAGHAMHGQVALQPGLDGPGGASAGVAFTPDPNFHGTASFEYIVSDAYGLTRTATATINVAPVNDLPVTADESATADEDTALYFRPVDLLANDTDVDTSPDPAVGQDQTLVISGLGGAQHGEVSWATDTHGQRLVRFAPASDYNGAAQFSYTVSDGAGGEVPATVHLTFNPVNDAPRLVDDAAASLEDTVVRIEVAALLDNDADVDDAHDTLRLVSADKPRHGELRVVTDAQGATVILFTPEPNYHGPASFEYTVADPYGALSTATARIDIAAVNDVPVVGGEQTATDEDRGLLFTSAQLLANETDADMATDGDTLHIARVDGAEHGTASLDAQGQIRFLPDADYHGPASFRYWVADQAGVESDARVSIAIRPVNDLPITQGERLTSREDLELLINPADLLANDSDVDTSANSSTGQGQVLMLASVANAEHAQVTLVASGPHQGWIRFVPDLDFHGLARFDYQVSDGAGGLAWSTATVDLAAVNDAPVVRGETARGDEDREFVFRADELLANDTDADTVTDGDVLGISRVGGAQHGTVTLDGQGLVRFMPDRDYNGPAQFSYWAADRGAATLAVGNGAEAQGTVQLMVDPVNDAPVARGERFAATEDVALRIAPSILLANETDVDSPPDELRIVAVGNARHGTVALDAQGNITFSPEQDYNSSISGPASFDYTVSDNAGGMTVGTALVDLAVVNDTPVALGERLLAREDEVLLIAAGDLLANDSDVDNARDELRISEVSNARHGQVSLDASGRIVFTPDSDYNDTIDGPASFDYVVSDNAGGTARATAVVELAAVNDAPTVLGETATLAQDTVARFSTAALLANDTDGDNPHRDLVIADVGNAKSGTVVLVNGEVVFTATPGLRGAAAFDYVVSDGAGGLSTATVNLNYYGVNRPPMAVGEVVQANQNQVLMFRLSDLLANDTDPDNPLSDLRIQGIGNARHGSVAFDAAGNIIFTPQADYNDTLGDPASFDYTVGDGDGGSAQATVVVHLAGSSQGQAPVTTGEAVTLPEDTVATFTTAALLANDTDVDNPHEDLSIVDLGNVQGGTVVLAHGEVVFTPTPNFNGAASFDYVVSDGAGGLSAATVTLNYTPVNDTPVGVGEVFQGQEDQAVTFSAAALLDNDSDVETPTAELTISGLGNARHGTVAMDDSGNIVFTPQANYDDSLGGPAQFDYTVSDGSGSTTTATVVVHLAPVNDAPAAQGESVTGALQDTVFHVPAAVLLANDSDLDNAENTLRVGWVGNASHGAVALNANGDVVFTPAPGFTGAAGFDYRVSDPSGALSPAVTAALTVGPVNHNPMAVDDRFTSIRGAQMAIGAGQLLGNDSDPDGQPLSVAAVRNAQHGTVSLDAQGNVTFALEARFVGQASFEYEASDGAGGATWATAYVDILQPNVAPTLDGAWALRGDEEVSTGSLINETVELRMSSPLSSSLTYTVQSGPYVGGGIDNQFRTSYTPTAWYPFAPRDYASLTVRVTDVFGNWTDIEIPAQTLPWNGGLMTANVLSTFVAPVVIDLNGDGVSFYQLAESNVVFELNQDGRQHRVAWADQHDGVLVFDTNGDRVVNGVDEFSFTAFQPGAITDLEGLRAFDTNHDGRLDASDAQWSRFGVWQDINNDGCSDAEEFRSLTQLGVTSIALQSNGQFRRVGSDVSVMGETLVTYADGHSGTAADASFMATMQPGPMPRPTSDPPPVAAPAFDDDASLDWHAEVARRAHKFVDLANRALTDHEPPLAFVPLYGVDVSTHASDAPELPDAAYGLGPPWIPQHHGMSEVRVQGVVP